MRKRCVVLLLFIFFLFSILISNLSAIALSENFTVAANQSSFLLDIADTRGVIYDRNFQPLTGTQSRLIAAVMPCDQSADTLLRLSKTTLERERLLKKLQEMTPFTYEVKEGSIYARGIEVFEIPQRYEDRQTALHIIGQIDPATGKGASGLEYAYDEMLSSAGGNLKIRYTTDALKRAVGAPPEIIDSGYKTKAGIVLTVDKEIQAIAERASKKIDKGAVIVMDPYTGDIIASVSRPVFNPNDPASSINDDRAPFINRAVRAYSVGSTFKMLVAAAALEQGKGIDRSFDCYGQTEVGDQVFRCHNINGHGHIEMQEALERSCNPYFISLAQELGGNTLAYKASQLGFASAAELAPGLRCAPGTLPTKNELAAPAAVANLGFGQGVLTATPVQIAVMMSSIVNGGGAVTPRLVAGSTTDGAKFASSTAVYAPNQVWLESAAEEVKRMLISVVENGSAKNAMPETGGAGGKTASAQSGQFENGKEIIHAWFAGFYPAQKPQYVIVVLVEGGDSGADIACPVFREISDGIAVYKGFENAGFLTRQ